MLLIHFAAYGLGALLFALFAALVVSLVAYAVHSAIAKQRKGSTFYLSFFLVLAVGMGYTLYLGIQSSYADLTSLESLLASLEKNRPEIAATTMKLAVPASIVLGLLSFLFRIRMESLAALCIAAGLLFLTCLYTGFVLNEMENRQENGGVSFRKVRLNNAGGNPMFGSVL